MTTQDLKNYINRVLGNGIRCILPSYWWKRLFGLFADRVDEVENSIATSIDEFAKNRPDIDDRTFYMSEDADLVAHNANTFARWYSELGSMKVKPFYIAAPFSDTDDTVIWWICSDGFEGTGYGPAFRNVIIDEKKYAVLFISDGRYMRQEMPSDSITVDTEMSSTSENAVQNKIIKAYVDNAITNVTVTSDTELSSTSTNPVQNKIIKVALDNKVDKIDGKQLSTEDFTTALKTKLEGLNAFDPTEINNKIDGLQSQFDTLVSGDASVAIESFNEIMAFLNGVQDTESLDGIIAGIEQQIAAKQDKIDDLETIRSGAALGATALQSYTEKYTGTYSKPSDGIPKADLAGDVQTSLGKADTALQEHQDISHLATKDEVTSLTNEIIANEEVTAAALNELNERVNAISENVSGETATKVELQSAVESLTNTILENEEITAAALNDLDTRLNEILTRLTNAGI